MKSQRFFISPAVDENFSNQYVQYFFDHLATKGCVVNHRKKRLSRSADMLRYGIFSNTMILHWPEDIVKLNFGVLQALISVITILLVKMKGGKIIWFCHNKAPHEKKNKKLNNLLRSFYARISTTIIVHSSDALQYLPAKANIIYLPHPAYIDTTPVAVQEEVIPEYDVLIWGNIFHYKGLDHFIESYKQHHQIFKVLIIGKADKEYYRLLIEIAQGTNITVQDRFLDDALLQQYFHNAKCIVLPYLNSDTFCSGALIHSLNSNKIIFGPCFGNFIDVYNDGGCLLYHNYKELFDQLHNLLSNPLLYGEKLIELKKGIQQYRNANSWQNFTGNLCAVINGYNTKPSKFTMYGIRKFFRVKKMNRKTKAKREEVEA
jgi:beta-1,4-mannosyltransferase